MCAAGEGIDGPVGPRDYWLELDHGEPDVINELITKLADSWLFQLSGMREELRELGNSTRHVHRLSFLAVVIEDDLLCEKMRSIRLRNRGWVWQSFWPPMKVGLENDVPISDEVIDDFSRRCGYEGDEELANSIRHSCWDDMINQLLR